MSEMIPTADGIWSRKAWMKAWMLENWPHVQTAEDAEREWRKRINRITRGNVRTKPKR